MSLKRILLGTVCLCTVLVVATSSTKNTVSLTHMVDLTHTLSGRFPIVPVPGLTFPFDQKPIASLAKNGYDPRELIVPAAVIDIHERAAKDRDTQLTVEDIKNWENRYGRLPSHAAVLM